MNNPKPYSVRFWGSDPDEDNDDCWTGADFATREEAEAAFADPESVFSAKTLSYCWSCTHTIELDGPDVHEERRNPDFRPSRDDSDDEWRREVAVQAGMAFGAAAYNEAMGWD